MRDPAPPTDNRMGGWTGIRFDEIVPGTKFPTAGITIRSEDVQRLNRCIGRASRPVDPDDPVPCFLLNDIRTLKRHLRPPPGVLHAQEELTIESPARIGEPLLVDVAIEQKYIRNGKRFVVFGQEVRRAADRALILVARHILYWPC